MLVALPGRARGEAAKQPEVLRPVQLTLTVGTRLLWLSPFSDAYEPVLEAYGYGTFQPNLDVSLEAAYSVRRFLDLGVHAGYLFGSAGSSGAPDESALSLHVIELGAFAHGFLGHFAPEMTGGIGLGVEGGVSFPMLALRGELTGRATYHVGPSFVMLMSDNYILHPAVRLRFLFSNFEDALAGEIDVPIGGLSMTFGANLAL
jgi:hypothetical protein